MSSSHFGQKTNNSDDNPFYSRTQHVAGIKLRTGPWGREEEAYAAFIWKEFEVGSLPLQNGLMLQTVMAALLNRPVCSINPFCTMRIRSAASIPLCINPTQLFTRNSIVLQALSDAEKKSKRDEAGRLQAEVFRLSPPIEMPPAMPWEGWMTPLETLAWVGKTGKLQQHVGASVQPVVMPSGNFTAGGAVASTMLSTLFPTNNLARHTDHASMAKALVPSAGTANKRKMKSPTLVPSNHIAASERSNNATAAPSSSVMLSHFPKMVR